MSTLKRWPLAAMALLAALTVWGCERNAVTDNSDIGFQIRPSSDEILVGEVVTVVTRSENLLGRDSQVDWRSTGGRLTTENNGRIARVRFDQPGAYTVNATLSVDGRELITDSTTINVRPIP